MESITIPALSDYHVHLRDGRMMEKVARYTAATCGRCLVMPNLVPPITTPRALDTYQSNLHHLMPGVDVLMTFKLLPEMTPNDIDFLAEAGAVAGKLYPVGVTTNSADGIPGAILRRPEIYPRFACALEQMEKRDLVLCLHGEAPWQEDPLRAEEDFLPFVAWVLDTFPGLRVVLEHVTTAEAVRFIVSRDLPRLAGTITLHHMMIHLGHLMGRASIDLGRPPNTGAPEPDGKLHPHLFCWPVAKPPCNREVLVGAAHLSSHFFLGSDSAPHPRELKECSDCCAGIFTAPVLASGLVQLFMSSGQGMLGHLVELEEFTTGRGDRFYRRPRVERKISIVRDSWRVPDVVEGIVPFLAGRILDWRVDG